MPSIRFDDDRPPRSRQELLSHVYRHGVRRRRLRQGVLGGVTAALLVLVAVPLVVGSEGSNERLRVAQEGEHDPERTTTSTPSSTVMQLEVVPDTTADVVTAPTTTTASPRTGPAPTVPTTPPCVPMSRQPPVQRGRLVIVGPAAGPGPRDGLGSSNKDLFTLNPDGSGLTNITRSVGQETEPAWSPDGRRIAFIRDGKVHVMDADGDAVRILTPNTEGVEESPAWSPDGSLIAFARDRDLWLMRADGNDPRLLLRDPGEIHDPSWSPDGCAIVFGGNYAHIFVLRLDGSSPVLINDRGFDPSWGPGGKIAFRSHIDGQLHLMNPDGSGLQSLGVGVRDPAWSADGTQLAAGSDEGVLIVNADGSNPRHIADLGEYPPTPSW